MHSIRRSATPHQTLDVDVLSFEESRRAGRRFGRVVLGYQLRDDRRVIAHGTVEIERAAGPRIEGVVAAIGDALDAAAAELARRLITAGASQSTP